MVEETTAWRQNGISRDSAFLVPPSDPLDANIACHLHCPSFSVADPHTQLTADESNVCIKQIIDVDFSPDRCLLYDHLLRGEALDGLRSYPQDILRIHESYTMELRERMSAIADICWGACVRDRMMQIYYLTPLRL